MKKLTGFRKVLIFILALGCFESTIIIMRLSDPAAIVAIGTQIFLLLGAAIYGNVKEHQAGGVNGSTN